MLGSDVFGPRFIPEKGSNAHSQLWWALSFSRISLVLAILSSSSLASSNYGDGEVAKRLLAVGFQGGISSSDSSFAHSTTSTHIRALRGNLRRPFSSGAWQALLWDFLRDWDLIHWASWRLTACWVDGLQPGPHVGQRGWGACCDANAWTCLISAKSSKPAKTASSFNLTCFNTKSSNDEELFVEVGSTCRYLHCFWWIGTLSEEFWTGTQPQSLLSRLLGLHPWTSLDSGSTGPFPSNVQSACPQEQLGEASSSVPS